MVRLKGLTAVAATKSVTVIEKDDVMPGTVGVPMIKHGTIEAVHVTGSKLSPKGKAPITAHV